MRIVDTSLHGKICAPLRGLLSDSRLRQWAAQAGHNGRTRVYSVVSAFWLCVWKQLQPRSARQVEDYVAACAPVPPASKRDGKDFCHARSRLPLPLFQQALSHLAEHARGATARWHSLTVWAVDGTTAIVPRTDANRAYFGYASNQNGASRFPVVRMVFLVSAGLVAGVAAGPYAVSELSLFIDLVSALPPNGVLLADGCYTSYLNVALITLRGAHCICPRRVNRSLEPVRRLGPGDRIECWRPPRPEHSFRPDLAVLLPPFLVVRCITRTVHRRGYRDFTVVLCTTLLDPERYPADDVARLYVRRWDIELDIRALKRDHGLARLTAKQPATVLREVLAAAVAFSAVRALIARSGTDPRLVSHSRARELIDAAVHYMAMAPVVSLPTHFSRLLALIAHAILDTHPRLPQPRAVLCTGRRYPYLSQSRAQWRAALAPHSVA